MIDLEPMWLALAKYQPYAYAEKHGQTWREMCQRKTFIRAERAARNAHWKTKGAGATASKAAFAAIHAISRPDKASYWACCAIRHIEQAIKDCNQDETNDGR